MRTLAPLILHDRYYAPIEAEIRRIFDEMFYRPLVQVLGMRMREITTELKNSSSALLEAIARGVIWYDDGQFKGKFNSKTSAAIIRLGGVFNVKSKTYSLPAAKLPTDLRFAQAQANARYEAMREKILSIIDNINPQMVDALSKSKEEYEKTLASMDADLQKTIPKEKGAWRDNPAISELSIEAKMTPEQKKVIAADWGNNLNLYIKKWTDENIIKLREEIQPHVMAGGRAEGLEKAIRDNYGVSARKAKFLARQETALLMSKFQETRYKDIGIKRYRWSTSHDSRVRPIAGADPRNGDHRALNGKIFSWDNPPVTCQRTGARNNPGQDYNCRCIAIPLVE